MAGRAGRAGYEEHGEALLMCFPKQLADCKRLINSDLPSLRSALAQAAPKRAAASLLISRVDIDLGHVRGYSRLMVTVLMSV